MPKKPSPQEVLADLSLRYDSARTAEKEAKNEKEEIATRIKAMMTDTEIAEVGQWRVTYKRDKDQVIKSFDETTFKRKEPKKYAEYVKAQELIQEYQDKYIKETFEPGVYRLNVGLKED